MPQKGIDKNCYKYFEKKKNIKKRMTNKEK